jgi:peptide/nickel transport system ATP-binding protein
MSEGTVLLDVRNLSVKFHTDEGLLRAVHNISFHLKEREILGIVGESGSGKSVTSLALLKLLPKQATIQASRVRFSGEDIHKYSERKMQKVRGKEIAMIFQDPMTSLNPYLRISDQMVETLLLHHSDMSRKEARDEAIRWLHEVEIREVAQKIDRYPHEFSGGQQQRIMIAMALCCNPRLLIADEPTTSLDVTIQAQILELLKKLQKHHHMSIILITHDLGIVAGLCDRVMVMYAGEIMEVSSTLEMFAQARHPYTQALLKSVPRLDEERKEQLIAIEGLPPNLLKSIDGCPFTPRCAVAFEDCSRTKPLLAEVHPQHHVACLREKESARPLLEIRDLHVKFPLYQGFFQKKAGELTAVNGLSFRVYSGETLGLVGESGCGKSTTARAILNLLDRRFVQFSGQVLFNGEDLLSLNEKEMRPLRQFVQMIFQNPYASLNPRMTVGDIIKEPLNRFQIGTPTERMQRVFELLELVGLNAEFLNRYPHEFSGGQRQRIGIARALALKPSLIVCDEPISALDVSIQAQIINLLEDLQKQLGLTYIFIAHDLAVVRHLCHWIAVMYLGKIVELSDYKTLYSTPKHPYTRALLSAVPIPDPTVKVERQILKDEVPENYEVRKGCDFYSRCPIRDNRCAAEVPLLRPTIQGGFVACHYAEE